jgi:anti-sigma factor RsiW
MSEPDPRLLLQAALDDELDAKGMLDVAQKIAADPELAAEWELLQELRNVMRAEIRRDQVPNHLREKIAAVAAPKWRPRVPPRPTWFALAASVVVAAGSSGISTRFLVGSTTTSFEESLVSDHMRALLAPQPVDIASSDRHEVKPWFGARLAASPTIVDLGDQGYTFVGGRIDVVHGTVAPTLVYQTRRHLISVTILPATKGAAPSPSLRGFSIARWQDGDLAYWAVSDISRDDLESFIRAFRVRQAVPTSRG